MISSDSSNPCPRCGGFTQRLEDQHGPYLRCFMGCWQLDLLQPPPEHLALLVKVETHNQAGIRQKSPKYQRLGGRPPEYQDKED